jgi:hypothetical protein
MDDRCPSTDEQQAVALDFPTRTRNQRLNRWSPPVEWLLAIPHYIVLVFLWLAAVVSVVTSATPGAGRSFFRGHLSRSQDC